MKSSTKLLLILTAASALSCAQPAKANLITNPGFETGDFTGWTRTGGFVVGDYLGIPPRFGNFVAIFSGGSLSQSVATTPGASYTIDFWVRQIGPDSGFSFSVSWGDVTLLNLTHGGLFEFYHEFTFTETASTASTPLLFQFSGVDSAWFLDGISVNTGVPDVGSTLSLFSFALFGLAAVRRKLSC